MSTFKHEPTGKRFFFIHIPRTAGRFFEQNLLKVNNFVWDDKVNIDRQYKSIDGVELAHFHREYYEKYLDVEGIPHITIVRNPIDRFISCSIFLRKLYGDDIDEMLEDEMYFYSMIQNYPLSQSVNWFRSQLDFISDKTHIWKFENGFGDDFAKWVSHIVDMDIMIKSDVQVDKLPTNESRKVKRSAKLIDNVRNLYRRDIETLYPELAPS
jgi:hypothetical protein